MDSKRTQIQNQCRAVIHLCSTLTCLMADHIQIAQYEPEGVADLTGKRTAEIMEFLGNTLNGMDVVTDEDKWMTPIFREAHKLYPVKRETD
jgi:hypothetical protein